MEQRLKGGVNFGKLCSEIFPFLFRFSNYVHGFLDGFTKKFCQVLKDDISPMLLEILFKVLKGGIVLNCFYEVIIFQNLTKMQGNTQT